MTKDKNWLLLSIIFIMFLTGLIFLTEYFNNDNNVKEVWKLESKFCIENRGQTYNYSSIPQTEEELYCYFTIQNVSYPFEIKNISGEWKFIPVTITK